MAYSKTTWANGDVIDAAKLNNLEDGVTANDTAISGLAPYELTGTLDSDTGAMTLSSITAAELYAVVATGRSFKITFDVGGASVETVCTCSAQNISDANYDFVMIGANGIPMVTGHLDPTDAVVFTPVS